MLKCKKYLSKAIATMMIGILIIPSVSVAAENKTLTKSEIPINMEPSTVIKYISNNEYTILQGDEASIQKTKENVDSLLPPEEYPMPEKGVIDIWKTGINYWGYSYSSSSLNNWASGKAHIEHNNDMI